MNSSNENPLAPNNNQVGKSNQVYVNLLGHQLMGNDLGESDSDEDDNYDQRTGQPKSYVEIISDDESHSLIDLKMRAHFQQCENTASANKPTAYQESNILEKVYMDDYIKGIDTALLFNEFKRIMHALKTRFLGTMKFAASCHTTKETLKNRLLAEEMQNSRLELFTEKLKKNDRQD